MGHDGDMVNGRRLLSSFAAVAMLCAAGCTATADHSASPGDDPTESVAPESTYAPPSPATSPSPSPSLSASPSASVSASPTADPPHPVSLPALMAAEDDGRGLRLGEVLARTDAYTQHYVTYRSGGRTVSGVLNRPVGNGPFPVLVLAHGYIDPDVYVNGQGLSREQDWLARAGYVVLHTDYRGHAGSDEAPGAERRLRLGYTSDVVNAVRAVRRARLPWVDPERVGLLGRSMGGGVVYNALVVRPGLVDAAVVFAPVSSDTVDNFNRWTRGEPVAARILDAYGSPRESPAFWRHVSPRTFFGRITEPVLIHHGTADESCPIRWSRRSLAALQRAGVDARMFTYPGAPHAFIDVWPTSMRRTVAFFRQHLRA